MLVSGSDGTTSASMLCAPSSVNDADVPTVDRLVQIGVCARSGKKLRDDYCKSLMAGDTSGMPGV